MRKEKVSIDKDWLIEKYVVERKNSYELSQLLGCSNVTVLNKIRKFNIPQRTAGESKQTAGCNTELLRNKKWLQTAYIKKQLSTFEIAAEIKTTPRTVRLALMEFGIPIRNLSEARKVSKTAHYTTRIKTDTQGIIDKYTKGMTSTYDLAKEAGCSQGVVINRLKEAGIAIRTNSEAIFAANGKNPDDYACLQSNDWLIQKYVVEGLSVLDISKLLNSCEGVVKKAVENAFGSTRNNGEAQTIKAGWEIENYKRLEDKEFIESVYNNKSKSVNEIADSIGVSRSALYNAMNRFGIDANHNYSTSSLERKVQALLIENDVEHIANCRATIAPMELDIVIPQCNIAIEINGVHWHSDKYRDSKYHEAKRLACETMGLRLLSLYEDDINSRWTIVERIILNAVGKCNDSRIFARKCTIDYSPDIYECREFLNTWHIQGAANQNRLLALRYDGNIVAVMAFNGNVLTRYATSLKVIGGFSKLLKNSGIEGDIISFVDLDTFGGESYIKAGFVFDKYLKPDYKYLVKGNRIHKFSYRLKRFKNDPELLWEEGLTEKQLAELNGIPKIYNSGMNRMVYKQH